ncbi:MAG: S8 family serine peptidase [Clostridia bacterium]|nr:S8 family serine peptidase [Clostridia bacterium]
MKSTTLKRIKEVAAVLITAVILTSGFSAGGISADAEKTKVIVNVTEQNGVSLCKTAENSGVEVCDVYENLSSFSALASPVEIEKLKSIFGDGNVIVSERFTLPEEPIITDAESAELMSYENGYDGEGTVIAVIDSCFLAEHEYFDTDLSSPKLSRADIETLIAEGKVQPGRYVSEKIPFAYDYYGNDTDVNGKGAHGTHVAGIAGGKVEKTRRGTAPGAQLLLMKVYNDETGGAETADIIKAINDAITLGADVINLSLGSPCGNSLDNETQAYEYYFAQLKKYGIDICCSAGNNAIIGKNLYGQRYPTTDVVDYGTISSPASADSAIAVSALTRVGGGYEVADYSSWGVLPGLKLKPDFCAVGTMVNSSTNTSKTSYGSGSGTSMAAPAGTGTVAVVKSYIKNKYPDLSDADAGILAKFFTANTAEILLDTDGIPVSPRAQGAGRIDSAAAVNTPVALYTDDFDTKINLYDNLGDSVTFSFTAENLSKESVTYNIKGVAVTDNYNVINGKTYVNGRSRLLQGAEVSFDCGNSVTLEPEEIKTITATLTFDASETERIFEVFTNGFFVEGFVSLYNDTNPEISIPFLGFKGSWAVQCAFDKNGLLGEYNVIYNNAEIPVYKIDGEEPFVAVPEGGKKMRIENMPVLRNFYQTITVMENLNGKEVGSEYYLSNAAKKSYWDAGLTKLSAVTTNEIPLRKKFLSALGEGEYYYALYTRGEYKESLAEMGPFKLKTVIDKTAPGAPRVSALKVSGGCIKYEISASDNFGIKSAGTNTEEQFDVMQVTHGEDARFDVASCDSVTVYDFAGNQKTAAVTNLEQCFICEFDGDGKLKWITAAKVPIVNGAPSYELEENTKIFIWDSNMHPKY